MPILQDQVSEKLQNIACGSQLNSRPLTTSALTLPFLSLTSLVNLHFKSVFLLFFPITSSATYCCVFYCTWPFNMTSCNFRMMVSHR
jgi:hypothetical protein